jgi:hypothetical protein
MWVPKVFDVVVIAECLLQELLSLCLHCKAKRLVVVCSYSVIFHRLFVFSSKLTDAVIGVCEINLNYLIAPVRKYQLLRACISLLELNRLL